MHLGGRGLPPALRDVTGDALWAAMLLWWVSVLVPHWPIAWRAGLALAGCFLVETSQLLHTPWLDALRATTPGHLVLGSGFDARDFVAYTIGVALAAMADRRIGVKWITRYPTR